jgi:hypothetical protein
MIRFLEWVLDKLAGRKLKKQRCRLDNCGDKVVFCCGSPESHRQCTTCAKLTTTRKVWVDPRSLRRRIVPICYECAEKVDRMQKPYREKRVRKDWSEVTTPVRNGSLAAAMNDQYVGVVRDTIRAFSASDEDFATVVPEVSPAALQRSIDTLGLQDEMYAEQRDDTTVLRRIRK